MKQGIPPRYTHSLQKSAKTNGNQWTEISTLGLLHCILLYVVDPVRVAHSISLCLPDYLSFVGPLARSEQTVALLLSHRAISPNGVHPPGSGTTPLHLAASLGRLDIVNLLLDQENIDDSLRDSQGRTCRDVARGKDVVRAIDGTRTLFFCICNLHYFYSRILILLKIHVPSSTPLIVLYFGVTFFHPSMTRLRLPLSVCLNPLASSSSISPTWITILGRHYSMRLPAIRISD